jgi:uncharacterized protein
MPLDGLLYNYVLECGLLAWFIAQIIKPPIQFFRTGRWSWGPLFSAGGMPSSHSALMVGTTIAVGLFDGFHTSFFAVAFAFTMIVIYDAAGVRREAGRHAEAINVLIDELLSGHPISEKQLREVLGHTPLEVGGGIILGLVVSVSFWLWVT